MDMWAESWVVSQVYQWPVWVHGLTIFLLLVGAYALGTMLQLRLAREGCSDAETAMVGASMALLAFLIGFTFSMALNRYDQRRDLVLAEANAIGTTYLRAQLLPEPERSEMLAAVVRYTDTRLAIFRVGEDLAELGQLQAASQAELARLWDVTMRGTKRIEPAPLAASLVHTVNETIDLAESRRTTYIVRLPRVVLLSMVLFAVITAGVAGFARGGRRHFGISLLVYLMLSIAITIIIDLDRPAAGAIRIVPGPLAETRAGMNAPLASLADAGAPVR